MTKLIIFAVFSVLVSYTVGMLQSASRLASSSRFVRFASLSHQHRLNTMKCRVFNGSVRLHWETDTAVERMFQGAMDDMFNTIADREMKAYQASEKDSIGEAYRYGDDATIKRLLADPAYSATDDDVWSAFGGPDGRKPNYTLMKQLFKRGGSPDAIATIYDTWSILGWAAAQGNIRLVRFLIENGVDASLLVNDKGEVAADLAWEENHTIIAQLLEDYTASYLQDTKVAPRLIDAIRFNDKSMVKSLLHSGKFTIDERDSQGNDALWIAAGYPVGNGRPDYRLISQLIENHGFKPTFNAHSELNHLVLWARHKGDHRLMTILSPFQTDSDLNNFTAVTTVARWFEVIGNAEVPMFPGRIWPKNYDEVVSVTPAELSVIDEEGHNALWWACGYPLGRFPDYSLVHTLLHHHKMNPTEANYGSPLSNLLAWAIHANDLELLLLLVRVGKANIHSRLTVRGEHYMKKLSLNQVLIKEIRLFTATDRPSTEGFSMLQYSDKAALRAFEKGFDQHSDSEDEN